MNKMNSRYDLTGKKFGRLTPIKVSGSYISKNGKERIWKCLCDCGNIINKRGSYLKSGDTKSCGCLRKDLLTTNGMSRTGFYNSFRGLINRCNNPQKGGFSYYGGRGIKCLWKSFEEFRDDMFASYKTHVKEFGEKQTTIDRIDNNGNYCKENCRWATFKEQANNKRNTLFLTFEGKTKTLKEWSKIKDIKYETLHRRMVYLKWSSEKILSPVI